MKADWLKQSDLQSNRKVHKNTPVQRLKTDLQITNKVLNMKNIVTQQFYRNSSGNAKIIILI